MLHFLSMYGLFVDTRILTNLARQDKFESLELDIENLNGLIKRPDIKKSQKGLESMAMLLIIKSFCPRITLMF